MKKKEVANHCNVNTVEGVGDGHNTSLGIYFLRKYFTPSRPPPMVATWTNYVKKQQKKP